jgi:hypothetical protein
MKKFINGQYVPVEQLADGVGADALADVMEEMEAAAASIPPDYSSNEVEAPVEAVQDLKAVLGVDISASALKLMAQQPEGADWTGLKGSGANGQITLSDVKAFLKQ